MQTRFHKKGFLRLASFETEGFWTSEVAYRRKKKKRELYIDRLVKGRVQTRSKSLSF